MICDRCGRENCICDDPDCAAELTEAKRLLRETHSCATVRDDGSCVGCDVGDFLGVSDTARGAK